MSRRNDRFSTYSRSTASRSVEPELPASVDLHRTRDARLDLETKTMLGLIALDEVNLFWTRTDEAHGPQEHVDQLRQFIETCAAEQAADRCYARISPQLEHWVFKLVDRNNLRKSPLGVGDHRSELDHAERHAKEAGAALHEERWAATCNANEGGDSKQDRG